MSFTQNRDAEPLSFWGAENENENRFTIPKPCWMAAMQAEGAVRAPGGAGNLLGLLLDEVTSLASTGAASIHISQEQGEKTNNQYRRERETEEFNTDKLVGDAKPFCFWFLKIHFKSEEHNSKPYASFI